MAKCIGILTSGGDTPGLNAAIRAVGKTAIGKYGMEVIGFRDGFRGLVQNRTMRIDEGMLSGILTQGGTVLGTSRDKPHRFPVADKTIDMTDVCIEHYQRNRLDALVCMGGGGTQKNALRLSQKGLNIITLPKTIDNDVGLTDITFGFDTALSVATDAVDRLHSTAHSHHRIIVVEIMGHRAGWLALGAGIAGGADVIFIPEIPYKLEAAAEAIIKRRQTGKHFSIVAVAEGAYSSIEAPKLKAAQEKKANAKSKDEKQAAKSEIAEIESNHENNAIRVASELERLTGLEARVTILGHLQRGGAPSAADRILCTQLGHACVELIVQKQFGIMVASRGTGAVPVPLTEVAGNRKVVPADHPWLECARGVNTNLGE